jgi:hypothetical protein
MLFYRKVCVTFLFSCFVFVAATDRHRNANGPFGKHHSANDELSAIVCHRSSDISSSSKLIPTVINTDLNVSTTVYASLDPIEVTWASTLSACHDDFVGIYSVDIPILTGTYTSYASVHALINR